MLEIIKWLNYNYPGLLVGFFGKALIDLVIYLFRKKRNKDKSDIN